MSGHDAFERILASLHEAMLDDVHWPTTTVLIDEACELHVPFSISVGADSQGHTISILAILVMHFTQVTPTCSVPRAWTMTRELSPSLRSASPRKRRAVSTWLKCAGRTDFIARTATAPRRGPCEPSCGSAPPAADRPR